MKHIILAEPSTLALVGVFFVFILAMIVLMLVVMGIVALVIKFLSRASGMAPPAPQKTASKNCPKCGAPLPPDSPEGLCPRCLMALNLVTQTEVAGETGPAKSPPSPPLPVSDVAKLFPQLEILECLGRGGMGAVYKARQTRLDRIVALKILSPEKQGNQKFAERFEREARALAKLHHPNIVTIFDFGEVQGNFYLLMEFVDGLTLRQLFQARKLTPPEALVIVPKICEALQYAHGQGIVHRDIKPENILMDREGRVKIADFGIAKILGDDAGSSLTSEQVIGTPHYMSPEQIEHPQTVDHRADIYSLGVVFYEMLTGELPLGRFQPPSKRVHIDVRLDEIILRALEKEPERRYQQASEVKTQVETVAATPEFRGSRGNDAQNEKSESQRLLTSSPANQSRPSPALPNSFSRTVMQFATLGVMILFACIILLLAQSSYAIGPNTWGNIRLALEILAALIFVAFFSVLYRAVKTNTPESWRAVKSWLPMLIVMVFGIAFGFWSPHLRQPAIKSDYIGQTWFSLGDSIQIASVERDANQMTVKGHYNLVSHDDAQLALDITSTNSSSVPAGSKHIMAIYKGSGSFELIDQGLVPGLPHVSMYADGHPFASVYFGTTEEADEESAADWITNSPTVSVNQGVPQIISMWPVNGATNVDPNSVTEIRVAFDRPMAEHSWSMTGGGSHFPDGLSNIHYDASHTTWVASVKLKPGWRYEFGLNSKSYQNFKSAEGIPLAPVYVTFQTSGQSLEPVDLPPKVISMTPADGATNVDLNLGEIRVVFDQPMEDGSWSMCNSDTDTNFPDGPGPVHYDSTKTVWTAPVSKLRPGTQYEFWLNWGDYRNFRSAKGMSLDPVDVTFTTASTPQGPSQVNAPQSSETVSSNVTSAAQAWLTLIDAGKYPESWADATAFFQGAISQAAWENSMNVYRQPLGDLISRKILSAKPYSQLPGAPDGQYVLMQFETSFANKKSAVETVTFMLEKDGQWKACGYFIK